MNVIVNICVYFCVCVFVCTCVLCVSNKEYLLCHCSQLSGCDVEAGFVQRFAALQVHCHSLLLFLNLQHSREL